LLNPETGAFVYRILAYKTLFLNPEHFGLKKRTIKNWSKIPVQIVKVDSTITDIKYLAKALSINKAIIKLFNPWLLTDALPNPEKKVYEFKIPKKPENDYSSYYNDLLKHEIADSSKVIEVSDSLSAATNSFSHVVGSAESLKQIADFYKVSEKEIREWNSLHETAEVKAGQTLMIKKTEENK
jgi:LysM repeat protein